MTGTQLSPIMVTQWVLLEEPLLLILIILVISAITCRKVLVLNILKILVRTRVVFFQRIGQLRVSQRTPMAPTRAASAATPHPSDRPIVTTAVHADCSPGQPAHPTRRHTPLAMVLCWLLGAGWRALDA